MNRDRHGRPAKRRPETSKLSVTVHGSGEFEIDTKTGLFLVAGCLVLSAAVLSLASSGLASPVSYIGVALGLFANIVPRRLSITVAITARIEWVPRSEVTGNVEVDVTAGSAD